MKNINLILVSVCIIAGVFFAPTFVDANTFSLEVDTGIEIINALEADVIIPNNLRVNQILTGNSALLFWVVSPIYVENENKITFAGLTPGGFKGQHKILSFDGELSQIDLNNITFRSVRGIKNDGKGTIVPVRLRIIETKVEEDTIIPESFDLTISSSQDIFDGRHFLSFATQDKGTGIKYYEYASTWILAPGDSKWSQAVSPMVLPNSGLFKRIYVRATDDAGNYRRVSTVGPYYYASLFIGTIILVCILLYLKRRLSARA